jgi:hypothetical protein
MRHQPIAAKTTRSSALSIVGLACAFLWSLDAQPAHAQPAKWKGDDTIFYQPSAECTQCHVLPLANYQPTTWAISTFAEYPIWKTHDKHAQAYAVLEGDRGQKIGESIWGADGKEIVKTQKGGCLNCHAMFDHAQEMIEKAKKPKTELDAFLKDGVSCGGCHGPSSKWKVPHSDPATWRAKKASEKEEMGMRDLRDPIKRGELCVSCHVGNVEEGKVVTHAMFAAGHPPLPPIEVSSFSRNLPQHWRDPQFVPYFKEKADDASVIENYHLQSMGFQRTRFALVGSVVALRETMKLARDQARAVKDDAARWPEIAMAHSDCYACHHELRAPSYRQARGFGYQLAGRDIIRTIPGRPIIRAWPLGLVQFSADFAEKPDQIGKLDGLLRGLAKATNVRPFGNPADIASDTDKVVAWCDELLAALNDPDPKKYNRDLAVQQMQKLCDLYAPNKAGPTPDFETARQIASVLKAMYEEVLLDKSGKSPTDERARQAMKETNDTFDVFEKSLDLLPFKKRAERTAIIMDMVRDKLMLKGENIPDAMDKFRTFAKNINVGDPAMLKGNAFLGPMLTGLSNDDFTAGLKDPKVVKALQDLSDQEEQDLLNAIRDYDPAAFKQQLQQFAKKLR